MEPSEEYLISEEEEEEEEEPLDYLQDFERLTGTAPSPLEKDLLEKSINIINQEDPVGFSAIIDQFTVHTGIGYYSLLYILRSGGRSFYCNNSFLDLI